MTMIWAPCLQSAALVSHSCVDGLRARLKPERSWFESKGWDEWVGERCLAADGDPQLRCPRDTANSPFRRPPAGKFRRSPASAGRQFRGPRVWSAEGKPDHVHFFARILSTRPRCGPEVPMLLSMPCRSSPLDDWT